MGFNIIFFYTLFFTILGSAVGIIFSPKVYGSLFSLFLLTISIATLFYGLDATYPATCEIILCSFFMCGFVFFLLKKTNKLALTIKLKKVATIILNIFILIIFGTFTILFFFEESQNSLYAVFIHSLSKSFDFVNFTYYIFPLILISILVLITAIVVRVHLAPPEPKTKQNEEGE